MTAATDASRSVGRRLRRQAAACGRLGSPLYERLLTHVAGDVEDGGPAWRALAGHDRDRPGSALGLRLMGAVHRLVLEGRAPALEPYYPSVGGRPDRAGAARAFRDVLEAHGEQLAALIDRPVQTNEVGRSAALLGGFLLVARETELPLRLLEIGASAGLNLRWDHYHYDFGRVQWGDAASPVRLWAELARGTPPLSARAEVRERAGCDSSPVDPTTEDGRLTLLSYVWPDQLDRLRRLSAAIVVAQQVPAAVERADAAEWLEDRLSRRSEGVVTVVFHSIVMQYLDAAARERVAHALERAGRKASATAPLARLAMESAGETTEVRLTTWPGGRERLLAHAGYHGSPLAWLADTVSRPLD